MRQRELKKYGDDCIKPEFQNFHPRSGENLNKIMIAKII